MLAHPIPGAFVFLGPCLAIQVEQIAVPMFAHRIANVSKFFGASASLRLHTFSTLVSLALWDGGLRHNVASVISSQPHMVSLLSLWAARNDVLVRLLEYIVGASAGSSTGMRGLTCLRPMT